ncbi:MAG TPA: hypothetical protein PKD83_00350 [Ignavibacteria bacterium]|nr:hypothetical protein [Ignavibacteria bacterium]
MKTIFKAITFTATVLMTIPLKKYFLKATKSESNSLKLFNNASLNFDTSLRNFHPNKGE